MAENKTSVAFVDGVTTGGLFSRGGLFRRTRERSTPAPRILTSLPNLSQPPLPKPTLKLNAIGEGSFGCVFQVTIGENDEVIKLEFAENRTPEIFNVMKSLWNNTTTPEFRQNHFEDADFKFEDLFKQSLKCNIAFNNISVESARVENAGNGGYELYYGKSTKLITIPDYFKDGCRKLRRELHDNAKKRFTLIDLLVIQGPKYDTDVFDFALEYRPKLVEKKNYLWSFLMELDRQMNDALEWLKRCKIIHRDIKPENIFLKKLPNSEPAFILGDLGMAIMADEEGRDPLKHVKGTREYMSEDLLRAKNPNSFASDKFALGATLLEFAIFEEVPRIRKAIEDVVMLQNPAADIDYEYVAAWRKFFGDYKRDPQKLEFKYPFTNSNEAYEPAIILDDKIAKLISKYYVSWV